jgi:hypothetical protein
MKINSDSNLIPFFFFFKILKMQKWKNKEPSGFSKPGPVHRFYRFVPVRTGFSGFLSGFAD